MASAIFKTKTVTMPFSYFWIVENKVLELVFNRPTDLDISMALDTVDKRRVVTNNKKVGVLITSKNLKSITKEARDYLSSNKSSDGLQAAAIVTESRIASVIANVFVYYNKPPLPIKIFSDKQKAVDWLCSICN